MRYAVVLALLASFQTAVAQEKGAPERAIEVDLRPGEPKSKLAPRYSPKGRQFKLAPYAGTDAAGFDPVSTRIGLGAEPGDGVVVVLTRSMKDKPYDQLYLDVNHDGGLKEPTVTCTPNVVRGSTWSSFEATLNVRQAKGDEESDLLSYPISLWAVVEDASAAPEILRISRRGFLVGEVKGSDQTMQLVVSDGDNDGLIGKGDWWELRSTPAGKTQGMREIGDFQWGGGKAWILEMNEGGWRKATLKPHDPQMTEEEDAVVRDHLREDRLAPRATVPVQFRKDADAAIAEAQAAKSRYFIKFETEWCGPCKTMAEIVFTAKDVAESAKDTICVVVDGDERKDLTEKHSVKGYPTGILFDGEGKEIARYVGYQSVKQMSAYLKSTIK